MSSLASQSSTDVVVEENVPAEMRDGTVLRADVYRPTGDGSHPVLVCRTPYGKRGEAFGADYVTRAYEIARRGYITVVQDARGRYASDGRYVWLQSAEAQTVHADDGYDTTEWAASLPRSNGQVGTWGNSYDGYTGLRTAGADPPSLAAAFVSGITERLQDENYGIWKPIYLAWLNGMAADVRRRELDDRGPHTRAGAESELALQQGKWEWCLPYGAIPNSAYSTLTEQLRDFLAEQHIDRWAFQKTHAGVDVPICHLTGWWDYVVRGTIRNFNGLRSLGKPSLRDRHRIVVGPWSHNVGELDRHVGDVDYGPEALASYDAEIVRWYDHALKGVDNGVAGEPPVKLFVLNENRWRFVDRWPPAGGRTELYLHSHGAANTPRGDGVLSAREPDDEPPDRYVYDPRDPVMSTATWSTRAVDQSVYDHRHDVLVYTTAPLERAMVLIGDVACVVWVASDAPETDFTAKLVEVRPDGRAIGLSTGILRTRYLDGYDSEVRLEPGEAYEMTIEMSPIGIRFEVGSRIRLDISSSDFPNFDRNHNTGGPFWQDNELRPAVQTVFHDRVRASRLLLPAPSATNASPEYQYTTTGRS